MNIAILSLNKTKLEGKFLSKNIINLSINLCQSEIPLLCKGLKFVPSANKIDRQKLKRELEEYGRKLHLMWHFRNDERESINGRTWDSDVFVVKRHCPRTPLSQNLTHNTSKIPRYPKYLRIESIHRRYLATLSTCA